MFPSAFLLQRGNSRQMKTTCYLFSLERSPPHHHHRNTYGGLFWEQSSNDVVGRFPRKASKRCSNRCHHHYHHRHHRTRCHEFSRNFPKKTLSKGRFPTSFKGEDSYETLSSGKVPTKRFRGYTDNHHHHLRQKRGGGNFLTLPRGRLTP